MKKLFFLFALFGLFATSCEESNIQEPNKDNPIENPDDDNDEKPVFTVESDDTILIEADGGEFDVLVTTNLEYNVVIDEESQSWVSVADTRAVRKEKLTFTIAPNEQYVSRVATISLIDKDKNTLETFTIEQHPASCASNELLYTSTDGQPIYVDVSAIGVVMTENIYENGVGVMRFNGIITTIPNQLFYNCKNLKSIILPESIAKIGSKAFYGCSNLDKIVLGENINSFGASAFVGCTGEAIVNCNIGNASEYNYGVFYNAEFTKVIIGDSVTTIGDYAFYSCNSLTSVTIGNSVKTIGDSAFYDCDSLTSVTIPDSITTIGKSAFSYCSSLKKVYCKPTTPPTGGNRMFDSNAAGRKIYVPASDDDSIINAYKKASGWSEYKDYIYDDESKPANDEIWYTNGSTTKKTAPYKPKNFGGATIQSNLYDAEKECWVITFNKDVTEIGYEAFYNRDSLTSVTIPDSVTTIGNGAFAGCKSLKEFNGKFAADGGRCLIIDGVLNAFALGCGVTQYTIPESVTTIGAAAFYNCDSLTSVTIPDSVTTIGGSAFEGCDSLTSVTIPDSVTTIESRAFSSCDSLTSVTIGNSVTTIGDWAFWECNSLTSVTIGNSVTTIGKDAFYSCTSLTSVTIPDSVTTIGSSAFYYCKSLTSVTIGNSVTTIGKWAFERCSSLTSVTIPDSVTTIGGGAFAYCDSLKEFKGKFAADGGRCLIIDGVLNAFALGCGVTQYTIPDSVTTIGYSAFRDCYSLTSVTIPDSVTTIGIDAFCACLSLTRVTIPDSVTTIGNWAFSSCRSLTSVIISDSVTTIGERAFDGCYSLKTVYCKPTTPPTGGSYMFDDNASGRKIYVPASDNDSIINAYKAKEYWSSYADYIFEDE